MAFRHATNAAPKGDFGFDPFENIPPLPSRPIYYYAYIPKRMQNHDLCL